MSNQNIFDNFIFDNFLKSYEDKTYKYPTLVQHKGTVIAFAMDNERRIYYTVLDLSDSDENKRPIYVEYWARNNIAILFYSYIKILPLLGNSGATPRGATDASGQTPRRRQAQAVTRRGFPLFQSRSEVRHGNADQEREC
ncbi:MAG: hypothetical protein F6K22_18525 [Okeania sp. SIO2F4]|uniref:hypothetical protein n=1 Tax=Okeania sp. SIO2F4 TaxID=2607790 RepID=UPI00142D19C7|nr:hypothetical protein [Okeania sp. SIO2F4]NES04646.1 hypothetical protein [Okeania sp. SIO2F4]